MDNDKQASDSGIPVVDGGKLDDGKQKQGNDKNTDRFQEGINEGKLNILKEIQRKANDATLSIDTIAEAITRFKEVDKQKKQVNMTEIEVQLDNEKEARRKLEAEHNDFKSKYESLTHEINKNKIDNMIKDQLEKFNVIPTKVKIALNHIKGEYELSLIEDNVKVKGFAKLEDFIASFKNAYQDFFSDLKKTMTTQQTQYASPNKDMQNVSNEKLLQRQAFAQKAYGTGYLAGKNK